MEKEIEKTETNAVGAPPVGRRSVGLLRRTTGDGGAPTASGEAEQHALEASQPITLLRNQPRLRRAALAELARRGFADFCTWMQPRLELSAFHRTYYRILERFARGEIRKLIVSMPPQHGKSLGSSVLLPAWLLGINPELRIAIASYNARLAARFNRQIRHILSCDNYASAFPTSALTRKTKAAGFARSDEQIDIAGHRGGTFAVGREGTLTGNAVDIFILDDLYKDAMEAHSPVVRENCWEWYTSVVRTRLHNKSQELIVFTRWHEEDLIGRIAACEPVVELKSWRQLTEFGARSSEFGKSGISPLDNALDDAPTRRRSESRVELARTLPSDEEGTSALFRSSPLQKDEAEKITENSWLYLNFEAIKESPPTSLDPRPVGAPLWPERHSIKLLHSKRALDPQRFAALYQGRPCASEGCLYGDRFELYDALPDAITAYGNYTDTADTGDDYLCSLSYTMDSAGILYITDVVYSRDPMEITEPLVIEMLRRAGTRQAFVEGNNGGRGFARVIAAALPQVAVEVFVQSSNKQARILSFAPTVLQRVRMPRDWAGRWPELRDHLCTYRRAYSKNRWHDAADALTGIVERQPAPGQKAIKSLKFKRS